MSDVVVELQVGDEQEPQPLAMWPAVPRVGDDVELSSGEELRVVAVVWSSQPHGMIAPDVVVRLR